MGRCVRELGTPAPARRRSSLGYGDRRALGRVVRLETLPGLERDGAGSRTLVEVEIRDDNEGPSNPDHDQVRVVVESIEVIE